MLSCKWVFKLKHDDSGNITHHMVRLVANVMKQEDGIDFQETLRPIIKLTMIRLILSIVVMNNWELQQFDVANAFLHGILKETRIHEVATRFS